jgi:hypothetical protein
MAALPASLYRENRRPDWARSSDDAEPRLFFTSTSWHHLLRNIQSSLHSGEAGTIQTPSRPEASQSEGYEEHYAGHSSTKQALCQESKSELCPSRSFLIVSECRSPPRMKLLRRKRRCCLETAIAETSWLEAFGYAALWTDSLTALALAARASVTMARVPCSGASHRGEMGNSQ